MPISSEDRKLVAILDKQGKERYIYYAYNDIGLSKISLSTYNTFNDDFKKLYKKIEPKKLGYGETMKINIGKCDSSNIMEVQLVLNGGKKVTYNLK